MNVAIYVRVSTQEQKMHGISLDAQEAVCREWVTENGYHLVDVYRDPGISARTKYTKRKDMLRLLGDLDKIDLVIFAKLDRWFRNVADYYEVQAQLEAHGVKWRAIQEDYETETASGRFKVNIMLAVAQDEADRTSERIKAVREYKITKGEIVGRAPIGYKIEGKALVIDPETAPVMRTLFDTYLSTFSSKAVLEATSAAGVPFNLTRLNRTLRNKTYCGDHFGIPCPAYITVEQYKTIRRHIDAKTRATRSGLVYIYSGLLRCGLCGGALTSARTRFNTKYYRCANHVQKIGVCDGTYANERKLEAYLLENLDMEYLAGAKTKKNAPVRDTQGLKKKLSRLKELYIDGDIEKSEYAARSEAIKALLVEPEEEPIAALPEGWREVYDTLSDSGKKAFWRSILKKLVIYKDSVEVFF